MMYKEIATVRSEINKKHSNLHDSKSEFKKRLDFERRGTIFRILQLHKQKLFVREEINKIKLDLRWKTIFGLIITVISAGKLLAKYLIPILLFLKLWSLNSRLGF